MTDMALNATQIAFAVATVCWGFIFMRFVRRLLLPKPLPGIPYNKEAAESLLGDLPAFRAYTAETGEFWAWQIDQIRKHQSPIVQTFIRPFSKPWIIVSDPREAYEILKHRSTGVDAAFDRSAMLGDWFEAVNGHHHMGMKTNTKLFKRNRNLVNPLMNPGFLNEVFAPNLHTTAMNLVNLWKAKAKVADGLPFDAHRDMYDFALDAVWSGLVPSDSKDWEPGLVSSRLFLANSEQVSSRQSDRFVFSEAPHARIRATFLYLAQNLEMILKSFSPYYYGWYLRQWPSVKKQYNVRFAYFRDQIEKGVVRMQQGKDVKCCIDEVLRREAATAKKEGREPDYHAPHIEAEFFGFITGGYHTTSSTLMWVIKILADSPHHQTRIRDALFTTFADARSECRQPTTAEITKTPFPYLDAAIEELLRCAVTEPGSVRVTTRDTVIFGHAIPAGTDVFAFGTGPGFFEPGFAVDESRRSAHSQARKDDAVKEWNPHDMHLFNPARWLTPDGQFDAKAGPLLVFGLGPRGCYGRKLAYMMIRYFVVLLLWNFELQACPPELSSYRASDGVAHQADVCFAKLRVIDDDDDDDEREGALAEKQSK